MWYLCYRGYDATKMKLYSFFTHIGTENDVFLYSNRDNKIEILAAITAPLNLWRHINFTYSCRSKISFVIGLTIMLHDVSLFFEYFDFDTLTLADLTKPL